MLMVDWVSQIISTMVIMMVRAPINFELVSD